MAPPNGSRGNSGSLLNRAQGSLAARRGVFSRRSSGCDGGGGGGDFAKLSGAHRIFEKPNCGRGQILKVKVS